MMWNSSHKKALLMVFSVLILAGMGVLAYSAPKNAEGPAVSDIPQAGEVSIPGRMVCLPHKEEGGVHTLECAFGLKDEIGNYYALRDSDPNYGNIGNVSHDVQVVVDGFFTSGESDRYKSIGVIEVRKVTAINEPPKRMSLSGTYLCLPHKDMSGPQTMECAFGLQTDDGAYYAIDFALMSQTLPEIKTGDRISANGVLVPIERLSTDHWQKYPVLGIFSVTDSIKKL